MKKSQLFIFGGLIAVIVLIVFLIGDPPPPPPPPSHHNYVVLLDLSDRLIYEDDQTDRDKEIISKIYDLFESKIMKSAYVNSKDQLKVVIAPQKKGIQNPENFEDLLYINMDKVPIMEKKKGEVMRRQNFFNALDSLYDLAVFSDNTNDYYGADIWKYFHEDLDRDLTVNDTLTKDYLFVITDGYLVVGSNKDNFKSVEKKYDNLKIMLLEATPREGSMEWDRLMSLWSAWFEDMGVFDYVLEKRGSIQKTVETIEEFIGSEIKKKKIVPPKPIDTATLIEDVPEITEIETVEEKIIPQKKEDNDIQQTESVTNHAEIPVDNLKIDKLFNSLISAEGGENKNTIISFILNKCESEEIIVEVYANQEVDAKEEYKIKNYLNYIKYHPYKVEVFYNEKNEKGKYTFLKIEHKRQE